MRNFKIFISLLLIAALIITTANAQDNMKSKIDSFLHRANVAGLFNGNILVADHNRLVYETAIGFSDASRQNMLTKMHRFNIGSIAKEFNAVGIMMLAEQGKLRLEDKVSKFLPELPQWANKISIQHLLQYTSGLPDVKWKTVKSDADNLADLKKLEKLNFEPGSNYSYNNNNVFLQRKIIEKISGMSFKKFVEQKILKPCGMKHAIVDPSENDSYIAKSFDNNFHQDSLIYPISGWTSLTLNDFFIWSNCINQFKLISPAATRSILVPVGPNRQAGLGGGAMENESLITHIHDGTSLNYQALLVNNVPLGRTVILMTNNKNSNLYDFNTAIQAILDGKPYQLPQKSVLKTFQKQLDSMNGKQILDFYVKLKSDYPQEYGFSNETTLNEIGYFLMAKNRLPDAIAIFEYNTQLFLPPVMCLTVWEKLTINKVIRKKHCSIIKKHLH